MIDGGWHHWFGTITGVVLLTVAALPVAALPVVAPAVGPGRPPEGHVLLNAAGAGLATRGAQ